MLKSAWQHAWLITQNITPPSLWQHCIHLHGNIVTVRAGVGNGGKIGYKMDWFVVHFDLFAAASVRGGQQQGQAGSEWGTWDKHQSVSGGTGVALPSPTIVSVFTICCHTASVRSCSDLKPSSKGCCSVQACLLWWQIFCCLPLTWFWGWFESHGVFLVGYNGRAGFVISI